VTEPTFEPSGVDATLRALLADVLGLGEERAAALTDASGLFGELPEFDSMAVATVLTEMEDRLGIIIDDDEIDGEIFETYGNLLAFSLRKVNG
jgi:acyl carrier protein